MQALFVSRLSIDYNKLELGLLQYTTIGEPICRSLWSLESSDANASDVFVFFTAIGASLKELFSKPLSETGITKALADKVTGLFNDRYDEFFFHSEIYFTAFALDPRRPCSMNFHCIDTC